MLFSSNVFLFAFLPLALAAYYLFPRRGRNLVLLLFSLVFYGWGEPVYLFLMIAVILMDYGIGLWISALQKKGLRAKLVLWLGIVGNLLLLGYFKYASFLLSSIQALFPDILTGSVPGIALPVGISFYVFQSMSYVVDVYRREVPAQKNPLTFGTYVSLFPQLIAGPIVRYRDVAEQMSHREEATAMVSDGIRLFIIGLSKKLLLANPMGNFWNLMQEEQGCLTAWAGLIGYSLQLYFDFSGYSDMAIGLGKMFGFTFLKNFDYPYISQSVTEFWRRWHISLSTWFKEYVYIPLGGNRKGRARQILNLLIVWTLTGLWHGASWNFVLWGLYYAIWLIAEKLFLREACEKLPAWLRHLYALAVIALGWSLFYFEDLSQLYSFLGRLFLGGEATHDGLALLASYLPLLLCAAAAATPLAHKAVEKRSAQQSVGMTAVYMLLLALCVAALSSQSYNPFIYFRF